MARLTIPRPARSAVAMAVALMIGGCGESGAKDEAAQAAGQTASGATAAGRVSGRPQGVVEDCSTRSGASFPAPSMDADTIVGPFVLVGGAFTPATTVREFGGDKLHALVRAGHRVTVAVSPRLGDAASLGYGPLPEGVELSPRDGHRVVTFTACPHAVQSGSTAGGRPVTFWSGFVLTRSPRCVPLDVWVDDEPSPRHTTLRMGVRECP
jgi:hypothetical protein